MNLVDQVKKRFEETYKRKYTPWVRSDVGGLITDFVNLAQKEFPQGKLLDLGCGNGWLSVYFAQRGFDVTGIDSSPTAIEEAEENVTKEGLQNVTIQLGDALDFPYEADNFDIVFDRGLLHHIPESDWNRYQQGLLKVLKRGGLFYLAVFSDKSVKHGASPPKIGQMWRKVQDESGYWTYDHFFNADLIEQVFAKDFEILSINEDKKAEPNGSLILYVTMRKV